MRILKLSPHQLNALFISHWHGDHTLGIGGVLQSLSASKRIETLDIYGPIGTKERVEHIVKTYYFKRTFNLNVFELEPRKEEKILKHKDFHVTAFPLRHGIPCIGYAFYTEPTRKVDTSYTKKFGLTQHPLLGRLQKGEDITYKGKRIKVEDATFLKPGTKICYIIDTKYHDELIDYAKNSNLLISEATYCNEDSEKCKEFNHMSTIQAANIAKQSKSKQLLLTHVSQRYFGTEKLELEAQAIFKNTKYAKDFDQLTVK